MKYYLILLFILSTFLPNCYAKWEEIDCLKTLPPNKVNTIHIEKIHISSPTQTNKKTISIQTIYRANGGCSYEINAEGKHKKYNFNTAGELNYITLKPGGTKTFFFFPKKRKLKIFRNLKNNDLKVVLVNGTELFFSSETGLIDPVQTTDFKINQSSINSSTGGLSLNNAKETLITFPYAGYSGTKINLNQKISIEKGSGSCSIRSHQIFNFKYRCDVINGAAKYCGISKSDMIKKVKKEYLKYEKDYEKYARNQVEKGKRVPKKTNSYKFQRDYIDGVEFKSIDPAEIKKMILKNKKCSFLVPQIKEITSQVPSPTYSFCLNKINEYFDSPQTKKELNKYIRIQRDISLHRLAWGYLKLSESNTNNIEETIFNMLKLRNPKLHQSFLNKELKTNNQKLLSVIPVLRQKLKSFNTTKNTPYTLKYGDVKMIQLLEETERHYYSNQSSGVMDFISMLGNNLDSRVNNKSTDKKFIEKILNDLKKNAEVIEDKISAYLHQSDCLYENQLLRCGRSDQKIDLKNILNNSPKILDFFYKKQFDLKPELKNNFLWKIKKRPN